jgi:hypothetical protein
MQAQKGRAGISRVLPSSTLEQRTLEVPLKEIFIKTIEYYLQKTQNVHNNNPPKLEKSPYPPL